MGRKKDKEWPYDSSTKDITFAKVDGIWHANTKELLTVLYTDLANLQHGSLKNNDHRHPGAGAYLRGATGMVRDWIEFYESLPEKLKKWDEDKEKQNGKEENKS